MTSRVQEIGKTMLHGIDVAETGAHHAVANGADIARDATRSGAEWATRQEDRASRKARLLKRDLVKQGAQLQRKTHQAVAAGSTYVKRNPWTAVAVVSAAAVLLGAWLGRRHH